MRSGSGSSNLDSRAFAATVTRPGSVDMNVLPANLCYLDGEFLPLNQAKVSVMDRGFLLGDGAYESIPVYGRRLFRFDDHMARFERSLGKLEIEVDLDRETWLARLRKVIEAFPSGDQLVYL